jgi:transposase-like protein
MSDEIPCCPSCESSRIYARTTGNRGRWRKSDAEQSWRCKDCDETFEAPDQRAKRSGGVSRFGAAKTLRDMDPDDVPELRGD